MEKIQQNKQELRNNLREFVNNIINKDYAKANANLSSAVRKTMKAKVDTILQENP